MGNGQALRIGSLTEIFGVAADEVGGARGLDGLSTGSDGSTDFGDLVDAAKERGRRSAVDAVRRHPVLHAVYRHPDADADVEPELEEKWTSDISRTF
jgi:hypothetical protein